MTPLRIEDRGADAQQRDAQERMAEVPARTHVRAAHSMLKMLTEIAAENT